MKFSPLWYIIFGLVIIFVLYILFEKDPKPNSEKIQSLEYAIAISDQQKKDLEDKNRLDSTAFEQKIAELRDSLSKEQKHGVKLSSNLVALKSKPAVVKIVQENPAIDSVFQQYDLLLETKDNQLAIQNTMIKSLEAENVRITDNFLERLKLSKQAFEYQQALTDSYKKDNRKVRRQNRLLKIVAVVGTVAGFFVRSSL